MALFIAAIIVGLGLLVWSSDRFVEGASALAYNLGVSSLVIGLTVVGFGTSAPEMMVAGVAALNNNPALGVGNAIGSNIANIALILGVTALIIPIAVQSRIVRLELPILLAATVFAGGLILNGYLSQWKGVALLMLLFAILYWLVRDALGSKQRDTIAVGIENEIPATMSRADAIKWFLVGLVVLLISARLLVWGAVNVAQNFGVSDLVIGLTIVAIGTSLPELAASIASARKGEPDLALGNVIGSNLFNLLAVLAIPALLSPSRLPEDVLTRDFPLMLGLTVALLLMAYRFRSRDRRINRIEGGVLLSVFVGYQWLLFSGSVTL